MEALPCSDIPLAAESDCSQPNSGTAYVIRGEPNSPGEHVKFDENRLNDSLLKTKGPQSERQGQVQQTVGELLTNSYCQNAGALLCDYQVKDQNKSCSLRAIEDNDINEPHLAVNSVGELLTNSYCRNAGAFFCDYVVEDQNKSWSLNVIEDYDINKPHLASENSLSMVNLIEGESPNTGREGALSFSEPIWLKEEESIALWVKWRGRWQAGIKCAMADCPLSTLKAKPTNERKKYFVIFFPHTKIYSWADMQLVRPIDELPKPIAYDNHQEGVEMVKDLTVVRRFIMQKLAVSILNIVDQLHPNVLMQAACDVKAWKVFAKDASHCNAYSDLAKMLLMLESSILLRYINVEWVKDSSSAWTERCQNTNSAESLELLKEELCDSILWNEINNLWGAPVQPTLGSEWKTWKHDVMKWFSFSTSKDMQQEQQQQTPDSEDMQQQQQTPDSEDMQEQEQQQQQQTPDSAYQVSLQIGGKRTKLEVRRANTHTSLGSDHSITPETSPGFFEYQDTVSAWATETSEQENVREVPVETDLPSNLTTKWNEIVVECTPDLNPTLALVSVCGTNSDVFHSNGMESTSIDEMAGKKTMEPGTKNLQQCIAYVEAKGRQCVRWANDGDKYCCVHTRFLGYSKAEKPVSVETPLCGGTTIAGTRCKHHSLPDSPFCKKHLPRAEIGDASNSTKSKLKRKREENRTGSEGWVCEDMVVVNAESPLQVDPMSAIGGDCFLDKLPGELVLSGNDHNAMAALQCIGSPQYGNEEPCLEAPMWYFLYCEWHLPSWLKRARDGKSRIISKEVFLEMLGECCSWEQKVHLHKACNIFYRLFKGIFGNPASKEAQFQWTMTEASKDPSVGELLRRLIHSEKDRIKLIWGLDVDIDIPFLIEGSSNAIDENAIKCRICNAEFPDDITLGEHWMENHKKEAQCLFRCYACAICLDAFTNKKLLETHVQERHGVKFVEQCLLLQCIPCGSHFGNMEQLWFHVLSVHPHEFQPFKAPEQGNSASLDNNSQEDPGSSWKFACRFCGLKFNLLPDLGRHHQAAHMQRNQISGKLAKTRALNSALRLKTGRLSRPKFKKGSAAASYRTRRKANANLKRRIQKTKSLATREPTNIGELAESQCSQVAKILFSEIQKTIPRPNNLHILSIVRSACCKVSLKASLEEKYGVLPESVYLNAAKSCSEYQILVNWHQEGFICPRGCKVSKEQRALGPLASLSNGVLQPISVNLSDPTSHELEVDESHCIINSHHLQSGSLQKDIVLCDDISFGKESIPVICVVDQETLNSLLMHVSNEQDINLSRPWESFTYVTKPQLHQSLRIHSESLQLACDCSFSTCCPETCDHVYLFDCDFEDAKDIYGKPMRGRFPYDENGRIILEQGYLVYECNDMGRNNKTCPNRILQNGVQVKLEVFKTEKKGWGVRAGEAILRGKFICELIGEVLDEKEARNRRKRYGREHCSYVYDIDAVVNDMSRMIEGQAKYVIDSTRYGNVSRFINSSCSPNLVNYQVLVESMDCERSHIGLYASRDIALGEELTFDYQYKLVPGEGSPCLCGSSKCRGRLY